MIVWIVVGIVACAVAAYLLLAWALYGPVR